MKRISLLLVFLSLMMSLSAQQSVNLNQGWRFILEDQSEASNVDFDDSRWTTLDVPHDWAFDYGYHRESPQGASGGYGLAGVGWYRKIVDIDEQMISSQVQSILFDGVYMNSEVWLNGEYLGKRPYGYIPFYYDVTGILKPGENVIAVRVDNTLEPSARWYHACGIYGDVSIVSQSPQHLERWATYITTPEIDEKVAKVKVTTNVVGEKSGLKINYTIKDASGKVVTKSSVSAQSPEASLKIKNPKFWDIDTPYLYEVVTELCDGKKVIDREINPLGVRTIEWRGDTGFWLNGRNVKIYGVCEHLEGGPVGGASNRRLIEWKLDKLKEMGCNAVRVSHNPQVSYFYEYCDKIGMMMVDEAFDGWSRKAVNDYGSQAFDEWWERDLRDMVRRSRNHPSVILYSVGNETHGDIAPELVRVCNEEDNTRLVMSGASEPDHMQVIGINGGSENQAFYENYKVSDRAFVGSESPHTWHVRGFYRTKMWYRDGYPMKNQTPFYVEDLTDEEIFGYDWTAPNNKVDAKHFFNSSYDNSTVRITVRKSIELTRDLPWYAGNFRWTGFDYRGEAGLVNGGWPFRAFTGGAMDMAGFKKDLFYLYQSQWRPDIDMVHLLPHWTHPDMKVGTLIPVWAYTTGDEVELFLNGESLGRRQRGLKWDEMQCEWMVPWSEGVIEAVAFRKGVEIARDKQTTAGRAAQIKLSADSENFDKGPEGLAIATIEMNDEKGNFSPYGENRIYLNLSGGAYVRSLENGSPIDVENNYLAESKVAFFGLLRAFVQTKSDEDVTLTAAAICGDKSFKQSNLVSIDVEQIALKGALKKGQFEIYYTLDGGEPSRSSKRYTEPFELKAQTQVKAAIYCDGELMMQLCENFGDGSGLYWGIPGKDLPDVKGMQAQHAKLTDADVVVNRNFKVVTINEGGSIEWYQENDGEAREVELDICYVQQIPHKATSLELWVNGAKIETIEFSPSGYGVQKIKTLPIKIGAGANAIVLTGSNESSPAIYYIDIKG